jgi:hypothetical protein
LQSVVDDLNTVACVVDFYAVIELGEIGNMDVFGVVLHLISH